MSMNHTVYWYFSASKAELFPWVLYLLFSLCWELKKAAFLLPTCLRWDLFSRALTIFFNVDWVSLNLDISAAFYGSAYRKPSETNMSTEILRVLRVFIKLCHPKYLISIVRQSISPVVKLLRLSCESGASISSLCTDKHNKLILLMRFHS